LAAALETENELPAPRTLRPGQVLAALTDWRVDPKLLADLRQAVTMCHKCGPELWMKPVKLTVHCRAIARPSSWS